MRTYPLQRFYVWMLALTVWAVVAAAQASQSRVYLLDVDAAIGPGVAGYIEEGLQQATEDGVACVVIRLNTPGGLAESMRKIVMAILASPMPVVVYVWPEGAWAASAGVMITVAADVAAMAPGTNIGAAHPVGLGGKKIDETMSDKVVNDMVAHARSVAEKQGHNPEWVEQAIRQSVSITETEALEKQVIDVIAEDIDDLLKQINGREVVGKGTLQLDDVVVTPIAESLRDKILRIISDPNIAYILMMIGIAGLYFELSNPGAIFPGVLGAISLILAFFAFQALPVNITGLLLIALALVFFIMEMMIASFGLLSIAGTVALVLGSVMLFDTQETGLAVAWHVLLPIVGLISLFFAVLAGLVFRAHKSRAYTGESGLISKVGVVKLAIPGHGGQGKVQIRGELWQARSDAEIGVGRVVRVDAVENLVLVVKPDDSGPA
jgi:membrane-bound serine protease (ClpP class)